MKSTGESLPSCYRIHIKGLVQGVGFRPFIYRIASDLNLKGWVINRNDGVIVKIMGSAKKTDDFIDLVRKEKPRAALIQNINIRKSEPEYFDSFVIKKSEAVSDEITLVSPDIAACEDCLHDLDNQKHRIGYPLVNCTNCGPRFSIIKELPYDRPNTTMDVFEMCPICADEYNDIENRRFHAQPVACNNCGPAYTFHSEDSILIDQREIIRHLATEIDKGKVFAVKGLGGFHLVCNALNDQAVERIRDIKNRDDKPFALMTKSVEKARSFAKISKLESEILESWKRPIVLLKNIGKRTEKVCSGLDRIGIMLPYMPFHHLLFKHLRSEALVMTSGNLSDEPIVISNIVADETFGDEADGIVDYNRNIYNRVDDSIMKVFGNKSMVLRWSRGFAPSPIFLNQKVEGILAVGAELVNSFCIGKGKMSIMSPYIGDLKDYANFEFFQETFDQYCKLFNFSPTLVVTDYHPGYLSTQFGESLSKSIDIPLVKVQHHHAHIASVMIEQKIPEKDVIGICMDGTGAGKNNESLGAEFLLANLIDVDRKYHFKFVAMPGGDRASLEPWRMALSYLYQVYGDQIRSLALPIFQHIPSDNIATVLHMLKHNLNCPPASSAGRLFDAVAAITGLCFFNTFQAEAPMKLESAIKHEEEAHYPFEIKKDEVDFDQTIKRIVEDTQSNIPTGLISARFHNTIVELCFQLAQKLRSDNKIGSLVLAGGTFQNTYLTVNLEKRLVSDGFNVYLPETVPVNDQGIALGQLGIASEMRKQGII